MKKNAIYRALLIAGVVLLTGALLYFAFLELMPDMLPLLLRGDAAALEEYLRANSTVRGALCTALLQMVQVWSVVLSATFIQVAAGVVYGAWGGFLLCHVSSVLAHMAAFFVWRRLGDRLAVWLPLEKKTAGLDFLRTSDAPAYAVVLACLSPAIPNGAIPLAAAGTRIRPGQYFWAVWGTSLPNILLRCLLGDQLLRGHWVVSAVLTAALLLAVPLLWKYREPVLTLLKRVFPPRGDAGSTNRRNRR